VYGTVFLARPVSGPGPALAIKRLRKRTLSWEQTVASSEIRILCAMKGSPHVVQVREVLRDESGLVYVAMDLAHDDLHRLLEQVTSIDEAACANLLRQLLSGLQSLHALNFVHRDVKPENILITRQPGAREGFHAALGDLGSACTVDAKSMMPYVVSSASPSPGH
jgi:serine/threonine protein kinase